jgi:hypothetical protein
VGKLAGKRQLGRQRHRQENNIRIDLRETAWEGVDWSIPLRMETTGGLL